MPKYEVKGTGLVIEAETPEKANELYSKSVMKAYSAGDVKTPEQKQTLTKAEQITQQYEQHQQALKNQGRDPIGMTKDWIMDRLGAPIGGEQLSKADPRSPESFMNTVKGGVQGVAQMTLPDNLAEATIMTLLPFTGRLAGGAITGAGKVAAVGRSAARMGLTASGGAIGGAASAPFRGIHISEGAKEGATTGLLAQGVAEFFHGTGSLIEAASKEWGSFDNTRFKTKVAQVIAPETTDAIGKDIPSVRGKLPPNVGGMANLQDEATGKKLLRTMFDRQEDEIGNLLRTQKFSLDEDIIRLSHGKPVAADVGQIIGMTAGPGSPPVAAKPAAPAVQILGPTGKPVVSKPAQAAQPGSPGQPAPIVKVQVLDAQDMIGVAKRLRAMVYNQHDALSWPAKQEADRITGEVIDRLQRNNHPQEAAAYEQLRQDWRKTDQLIRFVRSGGGADALFPGGAKGGQRTIDLPEFAKRLVNRAGGVGDEPGVSRQDFPALFELYTGPYGTEAASYGVVPVIGRTHGFGAHWRASLPPTMKLPPGMQEKVGTQVPARLSQFGQGGSGPIGPTILGRRMPIPGVSGVLTPQAGEMARDQ